MLSIAIASKIPESIDIAMQNAQNYKSRGKGGKGKRRGKRIKVLSKMKRCSPLQSESKFHGEMNRRFNQKGWNKQVDISSKHYPPKEL